jgi:hypothetical protein
MGYLAPYIAEFEDGKGGRVIDVRKPPVPPTIDAEPQPRPLPVPRPGGERRAEPAQDGVTAVTGPRRRILDALGWWEAAGVAQPTRVQVACVARYSSKSAAFKNPLSGLKTDGYVDYPEAGLVALTERGRKTAAVPIEPSTTKALHEMVLGHLNGPQRRILAAALSVYPGEIDRDRLASMTAYSRSSAAFKNPLSALRSLGLLDYPSAGTVRAEPILFIDKRRPRAVGSANA